MTRVNAAHTKPGKDHAFDTDLRGTFFTLSNILSLSRLALAVPFVVLMVSDLPGRRLWGAAIMVVAALTDRLDGLLARRLHQTSDWGKILDPLADKLAVAAVIVVLIILNELPAWFAALALGRDLLILSGGLLLKNRYGALLPSNMLGKWTVGFIGGALFLIVIGTPQDVTIAALALTSGMMVLSLFSYALRAAETIKRRRG